MNKFKSWSILFVLALLISLFFGCGGGGGGNDSSWDYTGWDTDPTPEKPTAQITPHVPIEDIPAVPVDTRPNKTTKPTTPTTPDTPVDNTPTTPTEPTPNTPTDDTPVDNTPTTPTDPTPTTPDTGDNTGNYDIGSLMSGSWYGTGGSGTIMIGPLGLFNIIDTQLYSMAANINITNITDNAGTAYITYLAYWDYVYNGYTRQLVLASDAEKFNMTANDDGTWELDGEDGTEFTVMILPENVALLVQTGTAILDNETYDYSLIYTIKKF